jgi:16S rRNA processing protein RimM
MLRFADFVKIGSVKKAFGYKGALMLSLESKAAYRFLNEKEPVFLNREGCLVPFFIQELRNDPVNPVVRFDDSLSKEDAARFRGNEIYLPASLFTRETNVIPDMSILEGFTLFDENSGLKGEIVRYNDFAKNPLFEVKFEQGTISLPCHEDFVTNLDMEQKMLYVDYPDGLIDSLF